MRKAAFIRSDARDWNEPEAIIGNPGDISKFIAPCERIAAMIEDRATPSEVAFRANEAAALEMEKILAEIDLWSLTAIRRLYPALLAIREERREAA